MALPSGDAQARAETGSVFWNGCEWREPQLEINTALPHHPHTCVPVMETADACRNNGPLHGPDSPFKYSTCPPTNKDFTEVVHVPLNQPSLQSFILGAR